MSCILFVLFVISILTHTHAQSVPCFGGDCSCPTATGGSTCILNCNTTNACKGYTLSCRPSDACIILCTAKSACDLRTTINANLATDVTIVCNAHNTCRNINITCGNGDCLLECSNYVDSCEPFGSIDVSHSQSFNCIGPYCPIFNNTTSSTYIPSFNPSLNPSPNPTKTPTFVPSNRPSNIASLTPENDPILRIIDKKQSNVPTNSPTQAMNDYTGKGNTPQDNQNIGFDVTDYLLYGILVCILCIAISLILCAFIWFWRRKIQNLEQRVIEQHIIQAVKPKESVEIPTTSPATLINESNESHEVTPGSNVTDVSFPNTTTTANVQNINTKSQMVLIGNIETDQYETKGELNAELTTTKSNENKSTNVKQYENDNESESEDISLMYEENNMETNFKITPHAPNINEDENEGIDDQINDGNMETMK